MAGVPGAAAHERSGAGAQWRVQGGWNAGRPACPRPPARPPRAFAAVSAIMPAAAAAASLAGARVGLARPRPAAARRPLRVAASSALTLPDSVSKARRGWGRAPGAPPPRRRRRHAWR